MILRLTPAHGDALDRALRSTTGLLLVRRTDGCFAQVADHHAAALVRDLAYAGIRTEEIHGELDPTPGCIPATAPDLHPAPVELVVSDRVRIRPLDLGAATSVVLRRRFALLRPPSPDAQRTCARLLRGDDVLFIWQRQALIERSAVRAVRRSSTLRPAIFDRGAEGIERRAFASDGALARWAFG